MNGNNAQSPLLTDRFQTTYRNNPGRRLAIGLIALVVGLGLLWWAVVEVRLWVVLVGGGLMTVGVGLLIDLIRDRLDRDVPLAVNGIVGLGLLVASAALVWSSDGWDLPYLAVIAVVAALFASAPLGVVAKAVARQGPWWFVGGGLFVSVCGAALIAIPTTSSMIGVAFVVLGLMGYQRGLRFVRDDAFDTHLHPQSDHGRRWGRSVSSVAGILAVVVLAPILYLISSSRLEVSGGDAAVVGVCTYLLLVALLTLGVSWTRIGLAPLDPSTVGVFGIVIASIGLVLIAMSDLTVASVLFVVGLVVVAAGSFVVWRGEGILIVVIVGFLVVWGVVDRTSGRNPDPAADAAGPTRYIVSLGDSFISGEGAREFFDGTDQDGDEETEDECRRSPTASLPRRPTARHGARLLRLLGRQDGRDQQRDARRTSPSAHAARGVQRATRRRRSDRRRPREHRRQRGPLR